MAVDSGGGGRDHHHPRTYHCSMRRKPSPTIQNRILREQENRCFWCSQKLDHGHVWDHLVPVAVGGSNHASNFVASCRICNSIKSAKSPVLIGIDKMRNMIMDRRLGARRRMGSESGQRSSLGTGRAGSEVNMEDLGHETRQDLFESNGTRDEGLQGTCGHEGDQPIKLHAEGGKDGDQAASVRSRGDRRTSEDGRRGGEPRPRSKRISFSVDEADWHHIKEYANRKNLSVSCLVRKALFQYIRRYPIK